MAGIQDCVNAQMELTVLSSAMNSDKCAEEFCTMLNEDVFTTRENKYIATKIIEMYRGGETIDPMIIASSSSDTKVLEVVSVLLGNMATHATISKLCKELEAMHITRGLVRECITIANSAGEQDDYVKFLESSTERVLNLPSQNTKGKLKQINSFQGEALREWQESINGGEVGVRCGIKVIDDVTNGFRKAEYIVVAARPSIGKGLANCVEIPMANGSTKRMGDIEAGDVLIGKDGKPTNVTGVYPQGIRNAFEIKFSNGTSTIADSSHRWLIRKRPDYDWEVMDTSELIKYCEIKKHKKDSRFPLIPVCNAVEYTAQQALEVDPWLLGVLIGDGCLSKGTSFSNSEEDIIARVRELVNKVTKRGKYDYYISDLKLLKSLREIGMMGKRSYEKFIPNNYKVASVSERVELLRGLVDTDGYVVDKGRSTIEYSTSSEQLCNDILGLVRGLGGRATYVTKIPTYRYKGELKEGRISYRMTISMPDDIIAVSSKKHLSRYNNKRRRNNTSITSIRRVEDTETTCITVDSYDHLFLCNDFIVTHNTSLAITMAKNMARNGKRVGFYSIEMRGVELINKVTAMMSSSYETEIPYAVFRGTMPTTNGHRATYKKVAKELESLPFYINDSSMTSLVDIEVELRSFIRKNGLDIVMFDYISLIKGTEHVKRNEYIQKLSMAIKALLRDLEIPGVVIVQLSRDNVKDKRKPVLSDLSESGQIERDADMVYLLHQEDPTNNNERLLIGAKGRNVAKGDSVVSFSTSTTEVGGVSIDKYRQEPDDVLF